jgi:hypothetical protein
MLCNPFGLLVGPTLSPFAYWFGPFYLLLTSPLGAGCSDDLSHLTSAPGPFPTAPPVLRFSPAPQRGEGSSDHCRAAHNNPKPGCQTWGEGTRACIG